MDLRTELKSSFVAGLLLLAPLAVTVFVVVTVFGWATGILDPIVRQTRLANYTANVHLLAQLLAAVLLVAFVILVGFLADRSIGRRMFGGFDRLVGLLPLVNTVYSSVRQVGDALTRGESRYERVVFVEYPREGLYSIGFVTGDGPGAADEQAGQATYNVFLPNSPNPTAGRLVVVPESDVLETDMSVRRGLRLVVTTGIADTQAEVEALREEEVPKANP